MINIEGESGLFCLILVDLWSTSQRYSALFLESA